MDKETLSNYGWIVILVLILAVMLALASPFGEFVSTAIKDVTGGFWDVNSASLNAVGLDTGDIGFPAECGIEGHHENDNKSPHGIATTDCSSSHTYTCECSCWPVPEGSTYYVGVTSTTLGKYTGATKIFNAGEILPCGYKPAYGDVFVDKYYEYRYNSEAQKYDIGNGWNKRTSQNGWGVRVLDDTKSAYGEILETIANKPINNLHETFNGCQSLIKAPIIPQYTTNMSYTFYNCKSLTTAPTIPNSVTDMSTTFCNCTSLTTAPIIPNSVTDMSTTFLRCSSLTIAPKIPNSVTNMWGTFNSCTALTTAPVIPNSVTHMRQTFYNCTSLITPPDMSKAISVTEMYETFAYCTSLKTPPIIPNGVSEMNSTFYNCKSLTTAPVIPNGVTKMISTFAGCKSLIASPELPESVINIDRTFSHCTSLTTPPSIIPNSVKNMTYTFNGCTSLTTPPDMSHATKVTNMYCSFQGCSSLKTSPVIPNSVTNMTCTFSSCKSLTGIISINANPTTYNGCFYELDFSTQNLNLAGTSTILDELGQTASNYCTTCNGTCKNNH